MLQLSVKVITSYLVFFFLHLYVFLGYFWEWLLFYPTGIFLALYVLAAIYYMVLSTSKVFKYYIDWLGYNIVDLVDLLSFFSTYSKYMLRFYTNLHPLVTDLIKTYSFYYLVFLLKRVEFYFFWLFLILYYC